MQHMDLDKIQGIKTLDPYLAPLTRHQRLERWASVLDELAGKRLKALEDVEYVAPSERHKLRAPRSPISVAFADPLLRADGLRGDTLGDAMTYFGLTERQGHDLLCDCTYQGRMTSSEVASRIRDLQRPLYTLVRSQVWGATIGGGILAGTMLTVLMA